GDFNRFLILSGLQNRSLVCSHQSKFCNPLRIKKIKKSPAQHAECGFQIARWLKLTYILLLIWGIVWLYLSWNGVVNRLDPGYRDQLEKAASTTSPPHVNFNETPPRP
ncbi:MAG: hypothetical protein WB791_11495, partial [Waddliaceae bacterium]